MRSKSILSGINVPIEPTSNVDSRVTNRGHSHFSQKSDTFFPFLPRLKEKYLLLIFPAGNILVYVCSMVVYSFTYIRSPNEGGRFFDVPEKLMQHQLHHINDIK